MISIQRLEEILKKFNKIKIAVIGDMMLDEYLIGKVNRISPEAPVPVVNIEEERFVLGGASNVANNLKSLEGQVRVYGVIGEDDNGKKFTSELEVKGIESDGIVVDDSRPTIIKSRVLSQGQQLLRLDWEKDTNISKEIQEALIKKVERDIDEIDAILLSDYNKGVLTKYVSESIIKIAKEHNLSGIIYLSWLENINLIRNLSAHNSNIVDIKFSTKPKILDEFKNKLYFINDKISDRIAVSVLILEYLVFVINLKYPGGAIRKSLKKLCRNRTDEEAQKLGFKDFETIKNLKI